MTVAGPGVGVSAGGLNYRLVDAPLSRISVRGWVLSLAWACDDSGQLFLASSRGLVWRGRASIWGVDPVGADVIPIVATAPLRDGGQGSVVWSLGEVGRPVRHDGSQSEENRDLGEWRVESASDDVASAEGRVGRPAVQVAWGRGVGGHLVLASTNPQDRTSVSLWDVDPNSGRVTALGMPLGSDSGRPITSLAFGQLNDGFLFLAAGTDADDGGGEVLLWKIDPSDGHVTALESLAGFAGPVLSVAWAEGESDLFLAAGGGVLGRGVGEVQVWKFDPARGHATATCASMHDVNSRVLSVALTQGADGWLVLAAGTGTPEGGDGQVPTWRIDPVTGETSAVALEAIPKPKVGSRFPR